MLKERLKEYSGLVNNEFNYLLTANNALEKKLIEAMKYSLEAGGKRLRPALVLEGYRLFKDDYKKALPFACAMEMVHTFSLIHDDLPAIDNDDFRRGKPTNHKAFGECTAILAGDGLLDYAYKVISDDMQNSENISNKVKALGIFSNNIFNMIKGEFVDTDLEGKDVLLDELMYMHNNKTGALIKASVRIGAILAEAPEDKLEKLTQYAEKIGLAFQIKDDILSVEGDVNVFGKPIGNDEARGKCTYVTKYGLEVAKQTLSKITKEAVKIAEGFNENGEFLKELAIYIETREK